MIENSKKTLLATADKLRANMDAAENKNIVISLIFLKYTSVTFQRIMNELAARFKDENDFYFLPDAKSIVEKATA